MCNIVCVLYDALLYSGGLILKLISEGLITQCELILSDYHFC
jgi:hypothetical protein